MTKRDSDLVILKTAFLLTAVDGHIDASERRMFDKLAEQCKEIDAKAAKEIVPSMEKTAMEIIAAKAKMTEKAFLDFFMSETAKFCDWEAFAKDSSQVRRAFVMWFAMAMSDREFSPIERKALARIRRLVNSFDLIGDDLLCETERQLKIVNKALASLPAASTIEASARLHGQVDRAYEALEALIEG